LYMISKEKGGFLANGRKGHLFLKRQGRGGGTTNKWIKLKQERSRLVEGKGSS